MQSSQIFDGKKAIIVPQGSLTGKRLAILTKNFQALGGKVLDLDLLMKTAKSLRFKAVKSADYLITDLPPKETADFLEVYEK